MKTITILFAFAVIFSACKKDETSTTTPAANTYINTTAGSSWTYHQSDLSGTNASSDYTITSTATDTTIQSRKYHVYNYSYGGNGYMTLEGHDYYQYDSIPITGGTFIERLYLKDDASVGDSWKKDFNLSVPGFPLAVPLTVTNKVAEKGISRTVNNKSYSDVIHVSTTLSSSLIPSSALQSTVDSYYAAGYGLIENTTVIQLNYTGIVQNVNLK